MPKKDIKHSRPDQRELAKIAKAAPSWRARRAAVDLLTDAALLADVGKNAGGWSIRKAAVAKLDPRRYQSLFAELAKTDDHLVVRLAVVERMTDPLLLTDVARYAKDPAVRTAARDRLIVLGSRGNDDAEK